MRVRFGFVLFAGSGRAHLALGMEGFGGFVCVAAGSLRWNVWTCALYGFAEVRKRKK